ncbi:hypothetical protein [Candidatus Promineifilum breve]|uniref:hypothetical protein n=1 Tax=Candidatus Promineifilum breve TaxID=1806508 RepID=UPI0007C1C145|nr:hypothetical protein [Candidatus Promineifilum breve]
MANIGIRWIVYDRDGNPIYMSEERWHHITEPDNHPEVEEFEEALKTTLQKGRRRQEPLNPRKYRYVYPFDDLPDEFNHIVAIVLFGFDVDERGATIQNNFVATAFLKHIHLKGGLE